MTKRDARSSLEQMLAHAQEAVELLRTRKKDDLDTDRVLSLAVVRLLEIVGEAANRVPKEEHANYASIPWAEIIGLRNRLIHTYDDVDHDIVWSIVCRDLPTLIAELNRILSRAGHER